MYRLIVVPLDGSPLAERALPYAEALARAGGSPLLIVQAASGSAEDQADAERYLTEVAGRLAGGAEVQTAVLPGDPAGAIAEVIGQRGADLVVLATHGRSGLGRWVYGSVAQALLRQSPAPVLLVRAWLAVKDPPLAERPHLLVPLDASPFSEEALPEARRLAEQVKGEVILMHSVQTPDRPSTRHDSPGQQLTQWTYDVQTPDPPLTRRDGRILAYVDQQVEAEEAGAADYLNQVSDRLAQDGLLPRPAIAVREGPPVEAIANAADELNADVIVMATHGRTGVSRALLGSVADGVLRHGHRPLLLVRPAALPESAS